jgi:hypothetical protein
MSCLEELSNIKKNLSRIFSVPRRITESLEH